MTFTTNGKQILRDGQQLGDGCSVDAAVQIVAALQPDLAQQEAWARAIMRASLALLLVDSRVAEEIHVGLAAALAWAQSIASRAETSDEA